MPVQAELTPIPTPILAKKRILLCTPYQESNQHLKALLECWHCVVSLAPVEDVLSQLESQTWDCIIFDPGYTQLTQQSLENICLRSKEKQQHFLLLLDRTQRKSCHAKIKVCVKPLRPTRLYEVLQAQFEAQTDPSIDKIQSSSNPVINQVIPQSSLRILLADDNQVNQKVARLRLRKLGYEIDIANNGVEVLTRLEQKIYDVILMDIQMPEMDGMTATQEIRKRYIDNAPYIIAMTANVMQADKTACFAAGMDDYVSKPIREDALRAALLLAIKVQKIEQK